MSELQTGAYFLSLQSMMQLKNNRNQTIRNYKAIFSKATNLVAFVFSLIIFVLYGTTVFFVYYSSL